MNQGGYLEWISANVLQTARVYWRVPVLLFIQRILILYICSKSTKLNEGTYVAKELQDRVVMSIGHIYTTNDDNNNNNNNNNDKVTK